jgi:hypothetical protein
VIVVEGEVPSDTGPDDRPSDMKDDANFTKRMRELVEDGYIVFDNFGQWRVTEKGLACLIAYADRSVKTSATALKGTRSSPRPRIIVVDFSHVFPVRMF